MELQERLKSLLEKRGMSQRDLAEKSGLTEAAICRYLKGERIPRSPAMAAMASALGVTMDYLAGGEETNDFSEVKSVMLRNARNLSQTELLEIMGILMDFAKRDREVKNGRNA